MSIETNSQNETANSEEPSLTPVSTPLSTTPAAPLLTPALVSPDTPEKPHPKKSWKRKVVHLLRRSATWLEGKADAPEGEITLHQALENFLQSPIEDVMIPRGDVIAVPIGASYGEVVRTFLKTGFHWLPVFRDTLDTVAGIVTLQCILSLQESDNLEEKWFRHIYMPSFYPASMTVGEALQRTNHHNKHPVVFVVDEYGGVEGMLTKDKIMQHLLELYGQDWAEEEGMVLERKPVLVVSGRIGLEDFSEEAQIEGVFSPEDFERFNTVGGWLCAFLGRVPLTGELIRHPSGLILEVRQSTPRKIHELALLDKPNPVNHGGSCGAR